MKMGCRIFYVKENKYKKVPKSVLNNKVTILIITARSKMTAKDLNRVKDMSLHYPFEPVSPGA